MRNNWRFVLKNKAWVIVVIIVLLAAAVGVYYVLGKSNGDGAENSSRDQASVEELGQEDIDDAVASVEKWIKEYFSGNSNEACKLVTSNYVKSVGEQDDTPSDCKGQVDRGSAMASAFSINAEDFTYSGKVEDNNVLVSAKWSGSESADVYRMAKENGTWKIDTEIEVVSEEEKQAEERNAIVDEWNNLSQEERDSWYEADGSGGFDAYAESKGLGAE